MFKPLSNALSWPMDLSTNSIPFVYMLYTFRSIWTNSYAYFFCALKGISPGLYPYCAAAADFNGDGKIDLIAASSASPLLEHLPI